MALYYPKPPEEGGKLTSRLTERNWRAASSIRFHKEAGFIRVYIVGQRYFDRGAGSFMGGGAYIFEARVVCESYPSGISGRRKVPEIKSAAGWGFSGPAQLEDGQVIEFSDPQNVKEHIDSLARAFWTVEEALSYANGEDGDAIALETESVRVTRGKSGYKFQRRDA